MSKYEGQEYVSVEESQVREELKDHRVGCCTQPVLHRLLLSYCSNVLRDLLVAVRATRDIVVLYISVRSPPGKERSGLNMFQSSGYADI